MENTATAVPRVRLSNISENTAATTDSGQAPAKPEKNRQIMMVWMFAAVATPISKMENINMEITNGSLRPLSSESGAHNVGPVANPRTKREIPNVAATWPM